MNSTARSIGLGFGLIVATTSAASAGSSYDRNGFLITSAPTKPNKVAFDPSYIFPVTQVTMRDVQEPAAVMALAPLTVAVDVALLPFGVLLGFIP